MSATISMLPEEFADLERFAAEWALPSELARNQFRVRRSQAELEDFYHTLFPRMDALCEYIDQFSLEAMPRPAGRLLQLGLMLMEVVPAVEIYHAPDVPNSTPHERLRIISPVDPIKFLDH